MAISQNQDQKGKAVGVAKKKVGEIFVIEMGGVDFCVGGGAPTTGASGDLKASPKGSLYIDSTAGKPYIKTSAADASVTWAIIGSIES